MIAVALIALVIGVLANWLWALLVADVDRVSSSLARVARRSCVRDQRAVLDQCIVECRSGHALQQVAPARVLLDSIGWIKQAIGLTKPVTRGGARLLEIYIRHAIASNATAVVVVLLVTNANFSAFLGARHAGPVAALTGATLMGAAMQHRISPDVPMCRGRCAVRLLVEQAVGCLLIQDAVVLAEGLRSIDLWPLVAPTIVISAQTAIAVTQSLLRLRLGQPERRAIKPRRA